MLGDRRPDPARSGCNRKPAIPRDVDRIARGRSAGRDSEQAALDGVVSHIVCVTDTLRERVRHATKTLHQLHDGHPKHPSSDKCLLGRGRSIS